MRHQLKLNQQQTILTEKTKQKKKKSFEECVGTAHNPMERDAEPNNEAGNLIICEFSKNTQQHGEMRSNLRTKPAAAQRFSQITFSR
jgi:hypothetical protein